MVWDNVLGLLKPELGQGGQDAAFVGDARRQNYVKGRKAVSGDNEQGIAEVVNIAHFALNELRNAGNVGGKNRLVHGITLPKI